MQLNEDYIAQLRAAVRSETVRRFVKSRLTESLTQIGIDPGCIGDIHEILESLWYRRKLTLESLLEARTTFQSSWRVHLNRTYFIEYEGLRWSYLEELIFNDIDPDIRLGRCLDIGCGRGWLTSKLLTSGKADSVLGIDAAAYLPEWNERLAQAKTPGLKFEQVPIGRFSDWAQAQARFDTVLMLYVLHHSNDFWAVKTLDALRYAMSPLSRLIVLEDSCSTAVAPRYDRGNIGPLWAELASSSRVYGLTDAFHIQMVLDFVAVKLLADFDAVDMACTYKRVDEWTRLFQELGFEIERVVYLGFPRNRDIDVPQSYFVLKAK
jgi:2-polyprenyl-3-methyl-5-hydroxy-6-metoxy-1,4-benzoquinol methylase